VQEGRGKRVPGDGPVIVPREHLLGGSPARGFQNFVHADPFLEGGGRRRVAGALRPEGRRDATLHEARFQPPPEGVEGSSLMRRPGGDEKRGAVSTEAFRSIQIGL